MKTRILLFLCLLASSQVFSQKPEFAVSVNYDSLLLGNYLEVTFSVENGEVESFDPPAFEGFRLVGPPSQSSRISLINGKMAQSIAYTFVLEPGDIGTYFIEPATALIDGQTYNTEPVEILVVPNPDGIRQQAPSRQSPYVWDDFFDNPFQDRPGELDQDSTRPPAKPRKKRKVYKL